MAYLSLDTSSSTTTTTTPTAVRCSSGRMMLRWWALQVLLGVAVPPSLAILPEIDNNDIHHLLDLHSYRGGDETAISDNHIVIQAATDRPTENRREELQDAFIQVRQVM